VEDEPRSGRTCTSKTEENVNKVRDLVGSDRRLTVRMISSVLNLNRQTVHEIFTFELGMQKNLCQAGPKNSHQLTERKPKECAPGLS